METDERSGLHTRSSRANSKNKLDGSHLKKLDVVWIDWCGIKLQPLRGVLCSARTAVGLFDKHHGSMGSGTSSCRSYIVVAKASRFKSLGIYTEIEFPPHGRQGFD